MNAISRSAEVLKLLAEHPRRFTDIYQHLELTKSTAHRLLKDLEQTGLIRKNPLSGRFLLGPLISQLAASPMGEHQFLITSSAGEMRKLRDMSGETVNLQVTLGTERMCLEEIQSLKPIKYVTGKGAVYPIFAGSAGKMLLAMMNDRDIQLLLKKFYYVPSAPNPIKDIKILWKEIIKARKLGHSISFAERIAGSASVAVPIYDYFCPIVLNILGPSGRFNEKNISDILEEMKLSSARISRELSRNTYK